MIIFELCTGWGCQRNIIWLSATLLTGTDKDEEDAIYEQLTAREAFLCD